MSELLEGVGQTLPVVSSSVIAIAALAGLLNTIRLWNKTNRPIVSAVVETHSESDIEVLYDLTVINSGNRPAVQVQLETKEADLNRCAYKQSSESQFMDSVRNCFKEPAMIPLLRNGDSVSNAFGYTTASHKKSGWIYGSSFPIQIKYKDLDGRKYRSKILLVIRYSEAFAGVKWNRPKTSLNQQVVD